MSSVTIENEPTTAEAASIPADGTITLTEVYEQMQADARQAQTLAARAGAKLDRCTYEAVGPGAAHSQAVYWCRTCHPAGDVGVCLACSMNCHLHCTIEELFEKRAFICDCGTGRAGGACQLCPSKGESNPTNAYNHNFRGEYCYCNGTYDPTTDVMFSCILCQDWFHSRCADDGAKADEHEEDSHDFICRRCIAEPKNDILLPYFDLAAQQQTEGTTPAMSRSVSLLSTPNGAASASISAVATPVAAVPPAASTSVAPSIDVSKEESKEPSSAVAAIPAVASESKEVEQLDADATMLQTPTRKRKIAELVDPNLPTSTIGVATPAAAPSVNESLVCHRPPLTTSMSASAAAPAKDRFVPGHWNLNLCSCPACTEEYRTRGLLWLQEAALEADNALNDTRNVLASMTDAEGAVPLQTEFDADALAATYVERMPRAAAIDIVGPFQLYQESIKRQFAELHANAAPGFVVTDEMVKEITARAKRESIDGYREMKRARANGDEPLPE